MKVHTKNITSYCDGDRDIDIVVEHDHNRHRLHLSISNKHNGAKIGISHSKLMDLVDTLIKVKANIEEEEGKR